MTATTSTANQNETLPAAEALVSVMRKAWIVMAMLGILSVAIFSAAKLYGHRISLAGNITNDTPLDLVIGNDVLSIPENMIRKSEQRQAGVAKSVDLYVHWPTKSGFTSELAPKFSNNDPSAEELVFIGLQQRTTFLDMPARFEPIYRKALVGKPKEILGGLMVQSLGREFGYVNEVLVYSTARAGNEPAFIARCNTDDTSALLAACEMDLFAGRSLEARIRFPERYLRKWQTLPSEIYSFIDVLRVDENLTQ